MHILNLNQIKVEYVISFSDALFAFSITFMALSIQIPTYKFGSHDLSFRYTSIENGGVQVSAPQLGPWQMLHVSHLTLQFLQRIVQE